MNDKIILLNHLLFVLIKVYGWQFILINYERQKS